MGELYRPYLTTSGKPLFDSMGWQIFQLADGTLRSSYHPKYTPVLKGGRPLLQGADQYLRDDLGKSLIKRPVHLKPALVDYLRNSVGEYVEGVPYDATSQQSRSNPASAGQQTVNTPHTPSATATTLQFHTANPQSLRPQPAGPTQDGARSDQPSQPTAQASQASSSNVVQEKQSTNTETSNAADAVGSKRPPPVSPLGARANGEPRNKRRKTDTALATKASVPLDEEGYPQFHKDNARSVAIAHEYLWEPVDCFGLNTGVWDQTRFPEPVPEPIVPAMATLRYDVRPSADDDCIASLRLAIDKRIQERLAGSPDAPSFVDEKANVPGRTIMPFIREVTDDGRIVHDVHFPQKDQALCFKESGPIAFTHKGTAVEAVLLAHGSLFSRRFITVDVELDPQSDQSFRALAWKNLEGAIEELLGDPATEGLTALGVWKQKVTTNDGYVSYEPRARVLLEKVDKAFNPMRLPGFVSTEKSGDDDVEAEREDLAKWYFRLKYAHRALDHCETCKAGRHAVVDCPVACCFMCNGKGHESVNCPSSK